MKRSELTEFAVEEEGFKLKIRRGTNGLPTVTTGKGSNSPFVPADYNSVPPMPVPAPLPSSMPAAPAATEEPGIGYVKSPMVGTFYRSPSPESKPFVDVGSKIEDNSLVCIIAVSYTHLFPPVSVYGTGTPHANQEAFLGSRVSDNPHQPRLQGPVTFQSYPVFYSR